MLPGITNHDEYSLVRESQEEELENKPNFGTLTLKRKKEEKERDAKMDQLRKKLKTDDEGECRFFCCVGLLVVVPETSLRMGLRQIAM
jgi:hypothetical protein